MLANTLRNNSIRLSRPISRTVVRLYSSQKPSVSGRIGAGTGSNGSSQESGNKDDSDKRPKSKLPLIGLGLLAVGTTFYTLSGDKNPPIAFIEPEIKPTFDDGKVSVIFVLGGPGAGKGTQCAKLVKDFGFVHLSAGDLLRAEQTRPGSKYGEMIAQYIRDGLIVPQEVTIALLEQAIQENYATGSTRFLVDGFPRKMDQAVTFEKQVAKSSFTLFFECPEQVMLKRLLERGKTSGRTDDNIESIKKRFRTFVETSMPVVDYFEKQGRVVKVSCDREVDEVYGEVKKELKERMDIV